MKCVIRRLKPGEEEVLADIETACFPDDAWTVDEFHGYECLVAEYEGRIAGFIVFHAVFAAEAPQESEWEILNVAVLPMFRRLGFARALISEVIGRRGTFFLEVRDSNEPARKLYRSLGFEQAGVRPQYYENPDESAIVMRLQQC